jgi:hypothetical protein
MEWPGIEPAPSPWKDGDLPPQPWYGPSNVCGVCTMAAAAVCPVLEGGNTELLKALVILG